ARHGELIGEKAVEALGLGGDDAERDGGRRHGCSTALASLARSCARPSSQRETASAIAPTVMAESATLNVGQRADPMPTSTKSTTPCALRTRSTKLPKAPAHTRACVTTSATRTAAAAAQNRRRSAPFAIFLFRLAADAQPGVREGVQPVEADVLAALLALTVLLRRGVQAAQRLVHVPEVAALLRREQERLLLLHGVGALVGHVERVAREVAVGGLEAGVGGLAVLAE